MTPEEIEDFQAAHKDWEGKALVIDGDLGPRTEWAMAISRLEPWRQEIVGRACSKVGIAELSPNRHPQIDAWNLRCGAPLGSPYCASFSSWCMSIDGLPEVREASALELGRSMRNTTLVLPGDFAWFQTGPSAAHIWPIIGLGPGEVGGVEANHNNMIGLTRRATTGTVRIVTPLPVQVYPAVPIGLPLVPVGIAGTR